MSDDLREELENADGWGEEDAEGTQDSTGTEGTETLAEETQEASSTEDVSNENTGDTQEGEQSAEVQAENQATEAESQEKDEASEAKAQDKAPASWKPAAREAWKNVPPEARKEIERREAEIAKFTQTASGARKALGQLKEAMAPYHNSMVAAGVKDPFKVVGALMNNDHIMRHGTQQDKAGLIASMVQKFGVDIETLDNALTTGQPAGQAQQNQPNPQIQDMIRQEMAPYQQILQNQQVSQQQQAYEVQQKAATDVQSFGADKEFFNDVRMQMADIVDMKRAQGQPVTLQQAYDMAVKLSPEISQVLEQRAVLERSQATEAKRNAASSVTGLPAGGGQGGSTPDSRRGAISAAWDEAYNG